MTRSTKLWLAVAVLFAVINLVGAGFAAAAVEWPHALLHVVLGVAGAVASLAIVARSRARASAAAASRDAARLEQLQQSLDVVAIEVERIGEAQRFSTKLAAERAASPR